MPKTVTVITVEHPVGSKTVEDMLRATDHRTACRKLGAFFAGVATGQRTAKVSVDVQAQVEAEPAKAEPKKAASAAKKTGKKATTKK